MDYDKNCAVCGKAFRAQYYTALYCGMSCKKKVAYARLRADPAYIAKRAAARVKAKDNGIGARRAIDRAEADLIMACKDAGWSGTQTRDLVLELFGWDRAAKTIHAVWRRYQGFTNEEFCVSASERIPDYRAADQAFLAAMRAAPECPQEGVFKDTRPLIIKERFYKQPASLGGSPAAEMANMGDRTWR